MSDAQGSVPSAFYNAVDLNGKNSANIQLNELIDIKNKKWAFDNTQNRYYYGFVGAPKVVLKLNPNQRQFLTYIYCQNFATESLKTKCKNIYSENLNMPISIDF